MNKQTYKQTERVIYYAKILQSKNPKSINNFLHANNNVQRGFQHCIGHVTTGSFMGRGNQYIQSVEVLYCKLLTISKKLLTFPYRVRGLNCRPQRWEASVLPPRHRGPLVREQTVTDVSLLANLIYFDVFQISNSVGLQTKRNNSQATTGIQKQVFFLQKKNAGISM